MSNYGLLVNEPTYIIGSLLDHVYVNNDSLQKFLLNKIEIVSVYFSDHHAVKFYTYLIVAMCMGRKFMFIKIICLIYVLHI